MLSHVAALVCALASATETPPGFGKGGPALRIAALETETCLGLCPPVPADASSDWMRSEEGRKANGCRTTCRVQQPAALLYRHMLELASGESVDYESGSIRALGKDGPELVKRLRSATREVEGRRLGPLCTRARAALSPADEKAYLECTGRTIHAEAPDVFPQPDASRALRCSVSFAERELDWFTRCPVLEAKADVEDCVQRGDPPARLRKKPTGRPREDCENRAVEALASTFRRSRR